MYAYDIHNVWIKKSNASGLLKWVIELTSEIKPNAKKLPYQKSVPEALPESLDHVIPDFLDLDPRLYWSVTIDEGEHYVTSAFHLYT